MIRRPPRSTQGVSSAASDVYKRQAPPVPELQGKAKHTKKKANPIVAGTSGPTMLVYHERPIPVDAYPELDTDLARDNLENDLPAADLEDL